MIWLISDPIPGHVSRCHFSNGGHFKLVNPAGRIWSTAPSEAHRVMLLQHDCSVPYNNSTRRSLPSAKWNALAWALAGTTSHSVHSKIEDTPAECSWTSCTSMQHKNASVWTFNKFFINPQYLVKVMSLQIILRFSSTLFNYYALFWTLNFCLGTIVI